MQRKPRAGYLTVKEAAALARLHYWTLYKLIERGEVGPAQGLICGRRQYLFKEAPF
jgi:excisionase family DNA binding protein